MDIAHLILSLIKFTTWIFVVFMHGSFIYMSIKTLKESFEELGIIWTIILVIGINLVVLLFILVLIMPFR